VVDQLKPPLRIDARIQRQFGERRPAPHQCAAGRVAHPAQHRSADTRRSDHRTRLAPERGERPLQHVESRAGQTHHLRATLHQMHPGDPAHRDDNDRAVIAVAVGRRSAGEAGVARLRDQNRSRFDHGLRDLPQLDQRPRPHHREHRPGAEAVAGAETVRLGIAGQHMPAADHPRNAASSAIVSRARSL